MKLRSLLACGLALSFAAPLAAQETPPPKPKDPPAQEAPKPGDPKPATPGPAKPRHPEIALKTDIKVEGRADKINYVHYFVWLRLYEYNLVVHSETPSTAEKWILAKVKKSKKARGTLSAAEAKEAEGLNPAKLRLETEIEVKYKPSKFQGRIVAHIFAGTIKGAIKDAEGKVLKEIKLRHKWGSNTQFKRKDIRTRYLGYLSKWILIELFTLPEFQALLSAAELEVLKKEIASYQAEKAKLYDDTP